MGSHTRRISRPRGPPRAAPHHRQRRRRPGHRVGHRPGRHAPVHHPQRPSAEAAEAVVHAALDAGVTLIDTADAYCLDDTEVGHNERTVAAAVRSWGGTDDVLIATKGGHTRPGGTEWGLDGSPEYLERACDASLQALGVDAIGLYQFHRPDPQTPWADSMGALKDLYDAGKVRMVGVSNADIGQIDEARAICGDAFVSVQNQFSPATARRPASWRTARPTASPGSPGARSAGWATPARWRPPPPSSARSPRSWVSRCTR
ncbi:aldo/keto reductase [Klenkia terrae]|uniref:aldo/keto reductase n=1 Tax=Klenkia terrae TaxID=1052259 RepID=UPI003610844D